MTTIITVMTMYRAAHHRTIILVLVLIIAMEQKAPAPVAVNVINDIT
jgi:hypothetical protein